VIEDDDLDVPMPPIAFSGVYAIAFLPFTVSKILEILLPQGALATLADPLKATPFTCWQSGENLHAFFPPGLGNPTAGAVVRAIAETKLPIPDSGDNFLLDLSTWAGATPETMWSQGMLFRPSVNPSSPKTGEFVDQGSGIYKLFADEGTAPDAFSPVQITLATAVLFEAEAIFAGFDFTQSGLISLEAIEYLGKHFQPAIDKFKPQVGDLFWSKPRAVLFLDLATNIKPVAMNTGFTSAISTFTYDG